MNNYGLEKKKSLSDPSSFFRRPDFRAYASFFIPQILGVGLLGGLLLAGQPFIVIGLVVGLALLILVTRKPEYGLYLMILSIPGQSEASLALGSTRVTVTQLCVLLALTGWIGNRVIYQKPFIPRPVPRLLLLYGLYLSIMLLSLTVARSTSEGLAELSRWLISTLAFWLAVSTIDTRGKLRGLIISLCIGPIIEAVIGIVQSRLNLGPESYAINADLSRAFGTFDKPNPYAGYLEMGLPLLVALLLATWACRNANLRQWLQNAGQPRESWRAALWGNYWRLLGLVGASGLVLLAILFSFSRGSWLGLAVGAVGMLALGGRKALPVGVIGGGALILVLLGVQTGVIPVATFGRVAQIGEYFTPFDVREVYPITDDNFAIVERMAMWQAGGNMVLASPWLGVGIGNYNVRYYEFSTPRWPESRGHAHNYYIHAAAETGLIGVSAYLLLVVTALCQGVRAVLSTRDRALRYVVWGAFGVILAVAFHNLVEDLHVLNMGIQWSAILALFYIVPLLDKNTRYNRG